MGTDIDLHIEVLVDGKWEHYATPTIKRWYWLFGLLAGVRDENVTPVSKPKGFPKDASKITRILYAHEGEAQHAPSWLNHDEIIKVQDEVEKWHQSFIKPHEESQYDLDYELSNLYLGNYPITMHWRFGLPCLPEGIDDVRFVFWFC